MGNLHSLPMVGVVWFRFLFIELVTESPAVATAWYKLVSQASDPFRPTTPIAFITLRRILKAIGAAGWKGSG